MEVPRTFSHYEILEKLGAGGMGVVYKARDTRLERLVALKFLPPHLSSDAAAKQRFIHEAQAASALDHVNIGSIYEIGESDDGQLFIAMPLYPGGTLHERIKAGISRIEAVDIARQLALGLAQAHAHGIVHRDIKPGNVMFTSDGVPKIIDFGLAKLSGATVTMESTIKGTMAYMSPEQARAEPVDERTDIWSLGVVLFEMISGRKPFESDSQLALMMAISRSTPPPLRTVRPDAPEELESLLSRALAPDKGARYPSSAAMASDLATYLSRGKKKWRLRARYSIALAAGISVLMVAGGAWLAYRATRVRWARNTALPEMQRLASADRNLAAMSLAASARPYLADDPAFSNLWDQVSAPVTLETTPADAAVEIKDYFTPEAPWTVLGKTPLHDVRIPRGYTRYRISKPGFETVEREYLGVRPGQKLTFSLDSAGSWPAGMVKVPGGNVTSGAATAYIFSVPVGPYPLAPYYIDRFEVSNREFQRFVDAGGYRRKEFWKQPFAGESKTLSWDEAMAEFRDTTGQPGPATWIGGHYPDGQENYPVGGVSWYEAAAYAEFAGKSLPSIAHWYLAAGPNEAQAVTRLSNLEHASVAPVGKFQGITWVGAYDMGGNVKEWCWNSTGSKRYILGGSWRDPSYQFSEPDAQSPFDRSPAYGFRCVRYLGAIDPAVLAPKERVFRDYTREKPVSDDVFRGYLALYAFDHADLKPAVDAVDDSSPYWQRLRVSYDAGHDGQRLSAILFLPKSGGSPPYQAVLYSPGATSLYRRSSEGELAAFGNLDYLIKGGRAVLHPIYQDTYERGRPPEAPPLTRLQERDRAIHWSIEIERSLDYLQGRKDIDAQRIAFEGYSMGSRAALRLGAYPPRVKACIILSGGLPNVAAAPEVDGLNFAPRLKIPTLIADGRYDWDFPVETAQKPMVRLIGSPEKDKRYVTLNYGHSDLNSREAMREVLDWLDRYLGRVR